MRGAVTRPLLAGLLALVMGCEQAEPPPPPAPDANAYVCSCECPTGVFTRDVLDFPACLPKGHEDASREAFAAHCKDVVCPALTIAVHQLGEQCMLGCRVAPVRRDETLVWKGISDLRNHEACDDSCDRVDCDLRLNPIGYVVGNFMTCTQIECDMPRCAERSRNICRPPVEDFLDTGGVARGRQAGW